MEIKKMVNEMGTTFSGLNSEEKKKFIKALEELKSINIIDITDDGVKVRTVKQPVWNRMTARIAQYNEDGTKIKSWLTQKRAAEDTNLSQSYISQLIKMEKEIQIKKKGFYFAWDY